MIKILIFQRSEKIKERRFLKIYKVKKKANVFSEVISNADFRHKLTLLQLFSSLFLKILFIPQKCLDSCDIKKEEEKI